MPAKKKKALRKYISEDEDLRTWIRNFSRELKTPSGGNVIHYPESFAKGYAKVVEIQDGLSFRMVDYRLNADFSYERHPTKDFHLIIYFYVYQNCERLGMYLNKKPIIETENCDFSGLMLTHSRTTQSLFTSRGTTVRGLTIQVSEEWLKKNLVESEKITLSLIKQQDLFQSIIRPKYRRLLGELFLQRNYSAVPDLYLSTRVMYLLDLFLEDVMSNGLKGTTLPRSAREMQSLLYIEEYLIHHYQDQFPSIDTLSKMALMSPTKLKQSFKSAFGTSLFNFFQKNRMHQAKSMLQANIHSVTEVGKILGYQNLSNFSTAFKKEFGVLPKDAAELT
ncbi:MAG TPA: AraC family transcriptional regulator [Ginsengibacter sp.]|nr:AraC family transcriptional regulator [Ginsengibacter sp.]HRP18085.1 AraC family transcriptional regulator [Ginsengibacter sp.]HRP45154.1 AraC family transcriptional regulator [Ginsengibacter sp.]